MIVSEISLWGISIIALLGGISPLTGLLTLLLLIASAFMANIVAGVIALMMANKNKQ